MPRIQIGDIIKTNYASTVYEVVEIHRGCRCPKYINEIRRPQWRRKALPSKPHDHYVVIGGWHNHKSYLNGYDAETNRSVWNNDFLVILGHKEGMQLTLF